MYKLYHGNNLETASPIGQYTNYEDCMEEITNTLKKSDLGGYLRTWKNPEETIETIDYGSWSNFYFIVDENKRKIESDEPIAPEIDNLKMWFDNIATCHNDIHNMQDWLDSVIIPNHIVLTFYYNPGTDEEITDYIIPICTMVLNNRLFILAAPAEGAKDVESIDRRFLHLYDVEDLIVNKELTLMYGDQFFVE